MITSSRQAILIIVISLYTRTVIGYCFSFGGGKELKMMKEKKNYLFEFFLIQNSHFVFCRVIFFTSPKKKLEQS